MGYYAFIGANYISAHSSTKAEYCSLAFSIVELTWITYLLWDNGVPFFKPPKLFCDNIRALKIFVNPMFHACLF